MITVFDDVRMISDTVLDESEFDDCVITVLMNACMGYSVMTVFGENMTVMGCAGRLSDDVLMTMW